MNNTALDFYVKEKIAEKIRETHTSFAEVTAFDLPDNFGEIKRLARPPNRSNLDLSIILNQGTAGTIVVHLDDHHGFSKTIQGYRPFVDESGRVEKLWLTGSLIKKQLPFYLEKKGFTVEQIKSLGSGLESLRTYGSTLFVAYRDFEGSLHCVERIFYRGARKSIALAGTRSYSFSFFGLNLHYEQSPLIYLCEGCATAITLAIAVRAPVYGCGSRNHLFTGVKELLNRFPLAKIILCCDCDLPEFKDTFQEQCNSLKERTRLFFCYPDCFRIDGYDFNDMMNDNKETFVSLFADLVKRCMEEDMTGDPFELVARKHLEKIEQATLTQSDLPSSALGSLLRDHCIDSDGLLDPVMVLTAIASLRVQHLFFYRNLEGVRCYPNLFVGFLGDSKSGKTQRVERGVLDKINGEVGHFIKRIEREVFKIGSNSNLESDILQAICEAFEDPSRVIEHSLLVESACRQGTDYQQSKKAQTLAWKTLKNSFYISSCAGTPEAQMLYIAINRGAIFYLADMANIEKGSKALQAIKSLTGLFDSAFCSVIYKTQPASQPRDPAVNFIFCSTYEQIINLFDVGQSQIGFLQRMILFPTTKKEYDYRPFTLEDIKRKRITPKEESQETKNLFYQINKLLLDVIKEGKHFDSDTLAQEVIIPDELLTTLMNEAILPIECYLDRNSGSIRNMNSFRMSRHTFSFLVLCCICRVLATDEKVFVVNEEDVKFAIKLGLFYTKSLSVCLTNLNVARPNTKNLTPSESQEELLVQKFILHYYKKSKAQRLPKNSHLTYLTKNFVTLKFNDVFPDLIEGSKRKTIQFIYDSLFKDGYVKEGSFAATEKLITKLKSHFSDGEFNVY